MGATTRSRFGSVRQGNETMSAKRASSAGKKGKGKGKGKGSKTPTKRSGSADFSLLGSAAYVSQYRPIRLALSKALRLSPDDLSISEDSLARRALELMQCMENTLGRSQASTATVRWRCVLAPTFEANTVCAPQVVRLPATVFRQFDANGPLATVLQVVLEGEKGVLVDLLPNGGSFKLLDAGRRGLHVKLFAHLRGVLAKSHPKMMRVRAPMVVYAGGSDGLTNLCRLLAGARRALWRVSAGG